MAQVTTSRTQEASPFSTKDCQNVTEKQPPRPIMWHNDFVHFNSPNVVNVGLESTVRPSAICSKCRLLSEWLIENYDLAGKRFVQEFKHHVTGAELERQYLNGCHLCTLMWHALIDETESFSSDSERRLRREKHSEHVRLGEYLSVSISRRKRTQYSRAGFEGFDLVIQAALQGMGRSSKLMVIGPSVLSSIFAKEDDQSMWAGSLAELSESSNFISTASSSVRQLAGRWLQQCVGTHKDCEEREMSSRTLPKRLLKIEISNSSFRVKLVPVDASFSRSRYAALSYCWGNSKRYKLTSATVETLKNGISICQLPKTIQDAVHVTNGLGIGWLWVDSLCIIQDSMADWKHEAATMVDVYQNCFICIAATGSADADDGLFAQRDPLLFQPCQMTAHLTKNLYVHSCQEQELFRSGFDNSALHKRGWVMQERLLPPRTLNFGAFIIWECRKHCRGEFGLEADIPNSLKAQFATLILNRTAPRQIDEDERARILGLWSEIQFAYSKASLTIKTDRLVALSGVISAIERSTGWRNICGLWEPFMIRELMWRKVLENEGIPTHTGPSWSWVFLSGGVFNSFGEFASPALATFEGVEIEDNTNDQSRAALRISGLPLRLEPLDEDVSSATTHIPSLLRKVRLVDLPDSITFMHDLSTGVRDAQLFIPLSQQRDGYEVFSGLVLAPSSRRSGAYERVGFGQSIRKTQATRICSLPAFSDLSKRQILTLV